MPSELSRAAAEAFERVFSSKHQKVFAFCYRVLQNYEKALEAAESAWRMALPCFENMDETTCEREVFHCAALACVNLLRRQSDLTHPFSLEDVEANAELLEEIDWETTGLRDLAYRVQTDIGLKRALNGISPKQRLAVILKFFYSASESEMGHVMGCSSGTARTYLRSGMLTAAKLFNTSEGNEHAAV